jgi:hypothetical protein
MQTHAIRPGDAVSLLHRICVLFALEVLLTAILASEASSSNVPEVKIAFIGDQDLTPGAQAVLQLIADESADAVLHNGDFDYENDPAAWDAQIDAYLGPDFPYFASVGNHDDSRFYGSGSYQEVLEARMQRLGIPWQGDLGVQSTFEFRGIFFVLTAPNIFGAGDGFYDLYIRDQLAANRSIWRISGWHENMTLMQVETKGNQTGWGVYEESRRGGAIITTAHSHTYSRSHLMSRISPQQIADTSNQLVIDEDDPATPEDEGRSFVVVSGIAGRSIRSQSRDDPWWASIYTSSQNAEFGALFGVFNEGGMPDRARFYFKNVAGEVIDEFFVTSAVNASLEPTLLVGDVAIEEGDTGSREADVHVVLVAPDGSPVSVDYATADGEATATSDYAPMAGQLAFADGVTEQAIRVPVYGDTLEEGDESFSVELSNASNAALPHASSAVTILDDDAPEPVGVTLSVSWTGGGNVEVDPPGGFYEVGTAVTLRAVPDVGKEFGEWSGGAIGSANPLPLVMSQDVAVVAHFGPSAPSLQELRSGASEGSSSVATGEAVSAASGALYLAAVASKPDTQVSGVSGLGLDWTPVAQQCAARGQTGIAVWQASGAPAGDGVVSAAFASAPANAVIAVSRYAAARSMRVSSAASANTNGPSAACVGGSDSDSYTFDLDLRGATSLAYVATSMRQRNHLPGPGFAERAELYQGEVVGNRAGLSVAEALVEGPGRVSVSGSFDGTVDWTAIALEVDDPRAVAIELLVSTGGAVAVDPPLALHPEGSTVTLTATPDPGHVFLGWGGAIPSGAGNPASLQMDADKVVTAVFVRGYSVTLAPTTHGGVGLVPPPTGLYPRGSMVALTATPDPGYVFAGWSGDVPAGQGNPASLLVDSDKQVGASFAPAHTVSVTPGSGGSVAISPPPAADGAYPGGAILTLTPVPDPGFLFAGWTGDVPAGAGSPAVLVVDGDKQVGATFVPGFSLSAEPTGSGSVEASPPPDGLFPGGTVVTLTATPAPGFVFLGWFGDILAGLANPASLVMDRDRRVFAIFVPGFSVALAPTSGGSVALSPPPDGLYPRGTVLTLTATPDPDHVFVGWDGDVPDGQGSVATLLINSDKQVGAIFARGYSIGVSPASGGSVALSPPAPGAYPEGTHVTATATADPGYAFAGWSGDVPAGAGNPTVVVADADKQLGAIFVPGFSLSVEVPTLGHVAVSPPPNGLYPSGMLVTLTASPDPGHAFLAWTGDVPAGAGNPAVVTMDADRSVGASFVPGFSVVVEPTPGGSVALSPPAGPYAPGVTVTATAIPDPGFGFLGWSGDLAGSPNPAVIAGDALVIAGFAALQPELQEIASGGSSESATVATATPLAAAAGDLYVAAISSKAHDSVTGVSGLGLAWSPVREQCGGRSQTGVSIWVAQGQPTGGGIVTATLGSTVRNAVIAVSRYSGSPSIGGVVSANSRGVSGSCSGGTDGASYAVDLDTTAPSALVYAAVAPRRRDVVHGGGFAEQVEIYQGTFDGDRVGLSLARRAVETPGRVSVSGSIDAVVDWALVSIEIRGPMGR